MRVCSYQNRLSTGGDVIQTKHTIYWDSKLLVPGVCFAKLVKTGLWAIWAEQHAQLEIDHVTQQPEETCQRT